MPVDELGEAQSEMLVNTSTGSTPTSTGSGSTWTVYTSTQPVSIPDPGRAVASMSVGVSSTISKLDLVLDISHTWVGDLRVALQHGSTSVVVIDRPGYPLTSYGCSGDNIQCTLDDAAYAAAELVCSTTAPAIGGTLKPNNLLSSFIGQDRQGTWYLIIEDVYASDHGTLNSWSLAIQ